MIQNTFYVSKHDKNIKFLFKVDKERVHALSICYKTLE